MKCLRCKFTNCQLESLFYDVGGVWVIPSRWKGKKLSPKDVDARWTKKNNETFYGYKNHIKADTGSKFINNYEVTSANVHDSQTL